LPPAARNITVFPLSMLHPPRSTIFISHMQFSAFLPESVGLLYDGFFSFAVVRQLAYFISRFFIMLIPIHVNSTPCITKIAATTENHSATVITCTLWNSATGQYIEIT